MQLGIVAEEVLGVWGEDGRGLGSGGLDLIDYHTSLHQH